MSRGIARLSIPSDYKEKIIFLRNTAPKEFDHMITPKDIRLLPNKRTCREVVQMRNDFKILLTKELREAYHKSKLVHIHPSLMMLINERVIPIKDPGLQEIARREHLNRNKIISTIIYVHARSEKGFEISGFIDYEQSLRVSNGKGDSTYINWPAVWEGKLPLRPRPIDLSYYNWHRKTVYFHDSDNYIVVNDVVRGLMFMHKGDHKFISIEPYGPLEKNVYRSVIYNEKCNFIMLFDHCIQKKL